MKRIEWIDFGKGFTIFLVVIGHVLLGLYQSNRFVDTNDFILFLTQSVYIFHIPVFFTLSGFLFNPLSSWEKLYKEIIKKFLILGIPYVFYSILQFSLQKLGGNTVRTATTFNELLHIWQTPIAISWYLYTLWWIYVVVGLISLKIKKPMVLFMISFIIFIINIVFPLNNVFLERISLWSVFFVLGYFLRDFEIVVKISKRWKFVSIVSFIILILYLWYFNGSEVISYTVPGIQGLIFFVSVLFAMAVYPKLNHISGFGNYFRKLGQDSLVIYLLHAPVASVARIALLKVGITNVWLHILLGTVLAWYGSIFAIYLMSKIPYIDFVFYPMKYLKKKNA